jgi:hypothetical protein
MSSGEVLFPLSVGATTTYEFAPGRRAIIFLVDATVPLYSVVFGNMKFFANPFQARQQIDACKKSADLEMPEPNWNWRFDAGFEHSIDGSRKKGWLLTV